jgi:trehalose 6-phosphate phosphatase
MSGERAAAAASPTTPSASARPLVRDDALARRLRGAPALMLLDVDGTLAPFARRPQDAFVPEATLRAVAALAATHATHVALVSGRAAPDALRMVPIPGLWAVGNHGFETIAPDGTVTVDPAIAPYLAAVGAAAESLATPAAEVPGARVEDKRLTLTLHYRLAAPGSVPALREAVVRAGADYGLAFTEGKMVFELRPPVHVDKGTASVALARRLGALGPAGSLFFAGDDVTDEDASAALRVASPQAVTVRVGEVPPTGTAAEFVAPTLGALRELLEWIGELRR